MLRLVLDAAPWGRGAVTVSSEAAFGCQCGSDRAHFHAASPTCSRAAHKLMHTYQHTCARGKAYSHVSTHTAPDSSVYVIQSHTIQSNGSQTDRKTPLGELNWIFTAITDTIAWNVLPRTLFQKLFRSVRAPSPFSLLPLLLLPLLPPSLPSPLLLAACTTHHPCLVLHTFPSSCLLHEFMSSLPNENMLPMPLPAAGPARRVTLPQLLARGAHPGRSQLHPRVLPAPAAHAPAPHVAGDATYVLACVVSLLYWSCVGSYSWCCCHAARWHACPMW